MRSGIKLAFAQLVVCIGVALPFGRIFAQTETVGRLDAIANRVEPYTGSSEGVPFDVLAVQNEDEIYNQWGQVRESFLTVGILGFQPSVTYAVKHSNNIREDDSQRRVSDFVHTVRPRLRAVLLGAGATQGSFWYQPSWRFFQENGDQNTLNHSGAFSFQRDWKKLRVTAFSNFAFSEDPLLEGGVRAKRATSDIRINASYPLSARTRGRVSVRRDVRNFSQGFDSQSVAGGVGVSYEIGGKTSIGLQGDFGRQNSESTVDSTFQNYQVTASYELTGKVRAEFRAGVQTREFDGGTRQGGSRPLYTLGLQWRALDRTAVSVNATRRIGSSNFVRNNIDSTTVLAGSVRQEIGDFGFNLRGGYGFVESASTAVGTAAAGGRDFLFANISMSYDINPRWRVGAFYNYRKREGNSAVQGATVNETGLQFSLQF